MNKTDNLSLSQELYGTILINIKSIIQNIFPLEVNKQQDSINYIIDQIASTGSIEKNSKYPELNEEIEEINQIIIHYYNYKKITKEEEQKNIYEKTAELIKNGILKNINSSNKLEPIAELEKEYLEKLNQATTLEEKNIILDQFNRQIAQDLQKKQNDFRSNKEITNVEEHKLVREGIVTKEEIEPYLSNYELLNALGEHCHLADEDDNPLIEKLFKTARSFYPDNALQGLKELMELSYKKMTGLLGYKILELLNNKQISFADINYVENNELSRINEIKIESDFKFLECIIAAGCSLTLQKLISDNKIGNFSKKELELVVALFDKKVENSDEFKGKKLSNDIGKLLLTLNNDFAYDLDDLLPFINLKDLGNEVFLVAALQHKQGILQKITEEKIDLLPKTLVKALEFNFDHLEIFKFLLGFDKLSINALNQEGETLLNAAIYEEKSEIIELLLSHKDINVNEEDRNGYTPLYHAINGGKSEVIELLLSHEDINVNKEDREGCTPLRYAINGGKPKVIELLLSHEDINVNEEDRNGYTILHYAINGGKSEVIELLLSYKDIKVNEKDRKGYTFLHYAIDGGKPEVIELLLSYKDIKVNEKDRKGYTPLHYAIDGGKPEVIELLLSYKDIKVNEKDRKGYTLLHYAIDGGKPEVIELLLSHKNIKVNKKDQNGYTPLYHAINGGKPEVIELLLSHKDINVNKKIHGYNPLEWANNSNLPKIAEILRLHEANVNEKTQANLALITHEELELPVLGALAIESNQDQ